MKKLVYTSALLLALLTPLLAAVNLSSSAPTANVISSSATGNTDTSLFAESANANHARGQLFTLPNGSGTAFEITAITIRKNIAATHANDTLTLRIFEGTQGQWDSGTGHSTPIDGNNYYQDTSVTPLHTESFNLNGLIPDDEYVTLQLTTPLVVNENSNFGFFLTYHQSNGANPDRFRHLESNSASGRLSINTSNHSTSTARRMVYYVQGTATTGGDTISLGSPFQDRMVLQRGKPVNVWGTAIPNSAMTVSMNGVSVNGTANAEGKWKVQLPSQTAGGPYSLVVTDGSETQTINDVLVGDVWLCFGQSNMVYTLNQMDAWHTAYENDIIANDEIRCLKINQDASLTEEESASMTWLANSTAGSWSAVGSVFAHQLHASTDVPVAFIWAAWGSSSIEGWMPEEMTELFPHFEEMMTLYQSVSEYRSGDTTSSRLPATYSTNQEGIAGLTANGWSSTNDDIFMRTRPNIIYNKMIHPVRDYGISGFIWYQGEANAGDIRNVTQYKYTLPGMVKEYRKRFAQGDLPFLGVQLPSINRTDAGNWNWFRESQASLENIANGHIAVSVDTGDTGNNIHPTDIGKAMIGERLALLARKYSLGENVVADGPRYSSMSVSGSVVTLNFTNDAGLTTTNSQAPAGFEIAGADMNFVAATSTAINGTQVTVSASSVANPVAVRYAWFKQTKSVVNLVNGADLPTAPFRTDNFPINGLGAEAPQSVDDTYEINRDTTLTTTAADGVLANDIDLNDDNLTATLVNDVSFGALTLNADGSFTYIPDTGYAGPDSFTYTASDGALDSPIATVNINVLGVKSGYYIWQSNIVWGSADNSLNGDPDNDQVSNFIEYALGSAPLDPNQTGQPTLSENGANFEFNFNNIRPGVNYEVQLSSDFVNWSNPAFALITSESTMPVVIPSSQAVGGKLFARLKISE